MIGQRKNHSQETKTMMKHIAISLALVTYSYTFANTEEVHCIVSSRPLSEEAKIAMIQVNEDLPIEETIEASRELSNSQPEKRENKHRLHRKVKGNHKDQAHLFSFYPQFTAHWFVSTNIDGSVVEIEDGSHWKMAANYATTNWRYGDAIAITPNTGWNSDYSYYLVNKTTGTYIPADLILGPIAFGPHSHWIIGLDILQGKVFLENSSGWKISQNDEQRLREWQINDTIIFGRNNSWFSSYDHVLINVNLNHYIHAKQY